MRKLILITIFAIIVLAVSVNASIQLDLSSSVDTNVTQETDFAHLYISDDVLLYMPFDYNSSTTVYDYSNKDNDATITLGSPAYDENGIIGRAMDFSYRDGHDKYTFSKNPHLTGNFTVAYWIKPYFSYKQANVDVLAGSTNHDIIARHTWGNNFAFYIWDGTAWKGKSFFGLNGNMTWAHIAMVFYGKNTTGCAYKDGVLDECYNFTSLNHPEADLTLGYQCDNLIDELLIINDTLTAGDIVDIYNSQYPFFHSRGEMLFQNIDLGTNDTANITLDDCQKLNGTVLQASFNGEAKCSFNSCFASNCAIGTPTGDADLTLYLDSNDFDSYSPLAIGNLTLDAWRGPATCSVPGDVVANEIVNFKNDSVPYDINVTVNVYTKDAGGNPKPVDGHNTYCHRITGVASGSVKKLTLYPANPANVGYTSITDANDPVTYGTVYWDFRPTNNVAVGETSAALYYTSSLPIGTITYDLLDDSQIKQASGSVPEFSTIGLIAGIIIIAAFLLFYIKVKGRETKSKKAQYFGRDLLFVVALLVIIFGVLGYAYFESKQVEPSLSQIQTYAVKEIMPDGEIVEKETPIDTPSTAISIVTDSGEYRGIVPLESNKQFRVE